VIAVDSNLLVYAHRQDSPWHVAARDRIGALAAGKSAWAIPWPCVHEFANIVTHPRIFDPASTVAQAAEQLDAWLESPSLVLLGESDGYWSILRREMIRARVVGPRIHDARIAAICLQNDVAMLWTADRDFSRFPALRTSNPLVGG
jgi:uncharacterized protein